MNYPFKLSLKSEIISIILIILNFVGSIYFYLNFPDQVPTHWNFAGEVDAWGSKTFGAFFLPALILGIYLLLLATPMFDPKKDRYKDFSKVYNLIKTSIVAIMTVIYFTASINGLGYNLPVGTVIPVAIGILFIVLGNYMSKIRRNWFVGIRTPWTLSDEEIWNKTSRLTGKLFVLSGLLFILQVITPNNLKLYLFIVSIGLLILVPFVYSAALYFNKKK